MKKTDKIKLQRCSLIPEPQPRPFVRSAHYEALHMIERTYRVRFMRMSARVLRFIFC